MSARSILDVLVSKGKLSAEQADQIETAYLQTGQSVESLLDEKKYVDEKDFTAAKAESLNVPFVTLDPRTISSEVTSYLPEPVARRYAIMPFRYDEEQNTLHIAMVNPLDVQIIEFVEKKTGKKIVAHMAIKDNIEKSIEEAYAQKLGVDVTAALRETGDADAHTGKGRKMEEVIREAPIAQIVSTLLEQADRMRSSDIHIEPRETDTRVRFRIDGILQERIVLPQRLHDAVVSRVKILADLKIDEKRIPQDGRFNFRIGQTEIDLRVSTLPTVHGEKVVMRLLKKSGGIPDMPELGLSGLALKNLERSILRPHGIILVTGPTGSGKTTTLYSVLSRLNNTAVNIMTLEDPVEYEISGINQVQINPQAGLTFATGLRSFLRQDPDIILVGEIRDTETTDLAVQAALTGHLVFSTLHTNNASGAIPRLLDMGAEPFLVASALNAVVGQRIVRRICPSCKEEFTPEKAVLDDIRGVLEGIIPKDEQIALYTGSKHDEDGACDTCGGSGYLGRVGIFEVFPVSEAIGKLILTRSSTNDIEKQAIKEGMITMKQDGYMKAIKGVTTIEEVLRVAEDLI